MDTPPEGVPGRRWWWKRVTRRFSCRKTFLKLGASGSLGPRLCVLPAVARRPCQTGEMVGSLRAAALLACAVLCALVLLLISGVQQFRAQLSVDEEELLRQLKERRRELVPLHQEAGNDPSGIKSRMDSSGGARGSTETHLDEVGCEALVGMQALEVFGSGYTKLVFKASLAGGQSVALKMVNEQGIDMNKCLEEFRDPESCRELVSYKLKKEMMLLRKLQHPNVIKLKGHCAGVQGGRGVEGGRLAIILEQGDPLQMIQLLQSPWEDRFRVCLDLVRLLHFLSRSPLGSIGLLDFQPQQFVTVSGELKLTDLDDGSPEEPLCQTDADCTLQFPQQNFSLACSDQGSCERLNEKRNLYNAYRYFFTYLLPHQAPPRLTHLVDHIMNSTGELKADVNQTLEAFEHILHLYKSGLHLDNIPPSILRDYTVMRGMGTSGTVEYRCWPSYSQQGCVLSVHGAKEAAHICNSHSQCNSFTLTGKKTWTGRLLSSFKSSFSHLVPDETTEVYVKKSPSL